jgi:glutaredoxin
MNINIKTSLQNTTIHWLCFAFFAALSIGAQAQKTERAIAPFKIEITNGQTFSADQLKKNKPTALIYFDPDCDHCEMLTKELLKQHVALKSKQIVMVTYRPPAIVKDFEKKFAVATHKNIIMGTEQEAFIVRKYYSIYTFPFVALYSSNGKPAGIFDKNMNDLPGIKRVIEEIKKLK